MLSTKEDETPGLASVRERAVRDVAEWARRQAELDRALEPYAGACWSGEADGWCKLQLDDLSGIPFLSRVLAVESYQHRARVRAEDRDLFAAVGEATEGYEAYCRDLLGLGSAELVVGEPVDGPLAVARACMSGLALETLVARARTEGCLAVHPYMGIRQTWELAEIISREASVPVRVLAPPPPVTWIANDKQWISSITRRVAGEGSVVETEAASDVAGLAGRLAELATRHRRVALKRTRCASAMGNLVLESEEVSAAGRSRLEERVSEFLTGTDWPLGEPVLVVAWEDAISSPSTQLWIPPLGEGKPRLDGVYEQLLEGEERVFQGSRPAQLPEAVVGRLSEISFLVSAVLQELGYVGRCSFDFILVGDPRGELDVRLTECNGRWGGTSTPMNLVDRLVPGPRPMYRAQDFVHRDLVGLPFPELLSRVGEEVYDPGKGTGHYIFYNVGCLRLGGKLDVIALGESAAETNTLLERDLPARLGLRS